MTTIVSLLSYRGGTGKSNIAANLAWVAAREGARVAVLDTDLQSPGVHIVLQSDPSRIVFTLSDVVAGKCAIEEAAVDLTEPLDAGAKGGKLFLLPSTMSLEAITRVLADGYEAGRLNTEITRLAGLLELDLLLLDSHPGLNRETLLTAAVSDLLLVLVRPDAQDFLGTAVIAEVARKVDVPLVWLIANKLVDGTDPDEFRARLEKAFSFEVATTFPLIPEMARLGSRGVFAKEHPDHPFVKLLLALYQRITEAARKQPPAAAKG